MPLNMVTHRVKFSVMKKFLLKVGLIGVLSVWGISLTNAQSYNSGYPRITNVTTTSATAEVNATVGGKAGNFIQYPTHYTFFFIEQSPGSSPETAYVINNYDGFIGLEGPNETFYAEIDNLLPNTDYIIHFVTTDSGGNVVIETDGNPTSVSFSTLSPLIANSFSPADDATDAVLTKKLTITFSEDIQRGNGTMTIFKNDGTDFQSFIATSSKISIYGNKLIVSHDDFLMNNSYYVEIPQGFVKSVLNGVDFEGVSGSNAWNFSTADLNIWSGDSSTDWNSSGNWETGAFDSGYSVLIPDESSNFPEISTSVTVNDLVIEPGASLTQTGGSLTINGEFVLQSSSEINASFIPRGDTVIVDPAKVRFYQNVSAPDRNYNFGVPVTGATKATSGITNYLYQYNNAENSYVILGEDTPLLPGVGYICRSDHSMIFTGTPVTSDVTVALERNESGGLGWNLVANPFNATVDFTKLEIDTVKVAYSFWIWDNLNNKYNTYNASSGVGIGIENNTPDIPSHQAFWVKVRPGYTSASIGFPVSALEVDSISYLKSASSTIYPTLKLESRLNGNSITDETALVFASNASNDFGDAYDTEKKLTTNQNLCQIYTPGYTPEGSQILAINGMQPAQNEISVPLGFKTDATGTVQINMKDNTLPSDSRVLLEDKATSDFIDLSATGTYEFEVDEKGTNNSRFVLHISGTESVITNIEGKTKNEAEKKSCFYTNNSEIIAYIGQLNNPTYRLLDINGKVIDSGTLNPESENRIMVSRKGMIIMIVESEKEKLEFKTVF